LLEINKLSGLHNRASFSCGQNALKEYLKKQASQDVKKNVATVIVAAGENNKIAGFYTLCASSVKRANIPSPMENRLPKYNSIPAILLGRLAVSLDYKGQGVGRRLMFHAFERCVSIGVGWAFLITDAKNEEARSFYRHFGFISLLDDEYHLCVTKQTISDALSGV
jgi:GNAT superfamily N-acetyltransferase